MLVLAFQLVPAFSGTSQPPSTNCTDPRKAKTAAGLTGLTGLTGLGWAGLGLSRCQMFPLCASSGRWLLACALVALARLVID
jgi:hypothetical protein